MNRYFLYFISGFVFIIYAVSPTFAAPPVDCGGLPGCSEGASFDIIGKFIASVIQYTAVIAVLALMYGGILYLLSSGEEEKTKKAKNVIIWALVGVLISSSAYLLINILDNFRI